MIGTDDDSSGAVASVARCVSRRAASRCGWPTVTAAPAGATPDPPSPPSSATGRNRFCIVEGTRQTYVSSPGVARSFCATCGTPLAYAAERYPGEIHLYVSTLDRPEVFEPGAHVHVGEQLPWLHLDDGLPRFQTTGYASKPLP